MNDKNKKNFNSSLRKRLKDYIYYAQDTVKDYDNLRKKFLDLSTYMLTFIIAIFAIIINISINQNNLDLFFIILPFLPSPPFFVYNIYFFIKENPTPLNDEKEDNWETLWFYRGLISSKQKKEKFIKTDLINFLDKFKSYTNKFIENDKKQLFLLFCYQSHRYNLVVIMRKIFFIGILATLLIPVLLIFFFNLILQLIAFFSSISILFLIVYLCIIKKR